MEPALLVVLILLHLVVPANVVEHVKHQDAEVIKLLLSMVGANLAELAIESQVTEETV